MRYEDIVGEATLPVERDDPLLDNPSVRELMRLAARAEKGSTTVVSGLTKEERRKRLWGKDAR